MNYRKLTRRERLAAEYYGYSLAHYADRMEVENVRFTELMPDNIDKLEQAVEENWPPEQIAKALDLSVNEVVEDLAVFREAREVVDAPNAATAFRRSIRRQLRYASDGALSEAMLDKLVTAACYCTSDLGCLLEWEGKQLIDCSEALRWEPDDDDEDNITPFKPMDGGADEEGMDSEEMSDVAKDFFDSLPPEAQTELMSMMDKAETVDDLIAFTLIGPCPRCGNELTRDGMSEAENEEDGDPTVGICPDCGHRWCIECGQTLKEGDECPHWDAWEVYCKEHDIDQDEDPDSEDESGDIYFRWLDEYVKKLE